MTHLQTQFQLSYTVTYEASSIMVCCLNPDCLKPLNPEGKFCQTCGTPLGLLRNRYRPIRPLGSGGFGRTYLAEDTDKLNERCVIKQFVPQVQNTWAINKATELFEQEALRLRQLGEHSQIPTLLAYFEQDQRLYLVQQYIEGQTLSLELAQQSVFSEEKIRELLLELLNILKFIHLHNVIHRDLKPDNIIRRQDDGKLVLIDFGIAKRLTATNIANPGTTIGSPGYASREQMQQGESTPASDLYSLGITCFHLLSGISPYKLWQEKGYNWVLTWQNHLTIPVSQELKLILGKLLQVHKESYQSAVEALKDVQITVKKRKPSLKQVGILVGILLLGLLGTQVYRLFYSGWQFPITISQEQPLLENLLTVSPDWVSSLAISPDRQTLVSGNADNTIKVWNLQTKELKNTLNGHTYPANSLALSPDAQTLVSGSHDGKLRVWNLKTAKLNKIIAGHIYPVNFLVISPDGQTLVSSSTDNTIKVWNLETGALKNTLNGHTDLINALSISPDGQTLVSGSADNTIKVWNLNTGQLKNTLVGHIAAVTALTVSPKGDLASGSADNTIKIWNLNTGQLKNTLVGHTAAVTALTVSPKGNLASGSADNTIKIWNFNTGKLKNTLVGHNHTVYLLAISSDEQTLISGSYDGKIGAWQLP